MNEYPITFYAGGPGGGGALGTAVLLTDMSLTNLAWGLTPAGNGTEYSAFPAGNPASPSWATIPNFLHQATSLSVNIATTYLSPSTGVTVAFVGTFPTGWSFNTSTNILAYNGTSVAGPLSGYFVATLTSSGAFSSSNVFSMAGIGSSLLPDTTAPTVPLGIAISNILSTSATISGYSSSDPSPNGAAWSGLEQYVITIPGAPGSAFQVLPGSRGTQAAFAFSDIGAQTSTITQSGADLTFSTTATDSPYPTNSALAAASFQLTATGWIATAKVPASFTSGGKFDNLRIEARTNLSTTGPYVAVTCCPIALGGGVGSEARSITGGSTAKIVTTANSTGPVWLYLSRSSDTYTFAWSLDGNNWQSLGSTTQVMGNPLYVVFGANTSAGGPMVSQALQQCNVTTLPSWSLNLSGLTPGANYSATVTAEDTLLNQSASSAAVAFTTAGGGGGGGVAAFPVVFTDALGAVSNYPTSAWQNAVCRFGLIELLGFLGLPTAIGMSMSTLMSTLKTKAAAAGSAYCKTIQYQMEEDFWTNSSVTGFFDFCMLNQLNTNAGWWLTSTYPTLTKVTGDTNHSVTQMTSFCPTYNITTVGSVTGPGTVNLPQFWAWKEYQQFVLGKVNALNSSDPAGAFDNTANPNVDGFEHDNRFYIPRYSGNWANNATSYTGFSVSSMTPIIHPLAVGDADMVNYFRGLMPTVLQMGNCDHFNYAGSAGTSVTYDAAVIGLWDYVMAEHLLNNTGYQKNTAANWGAFQTAMVAFEQLAKPATGYVIAELTGNGSNDSWASTAQSALTMYPTVGNDHQVARFNYCYAALMHDPTGSGANWMPGIRNPNSSNIKWFDEFDKSGTQLNWMGQPLAARSLTPWLAQGPIGLNKRDYDHGGVILNPPGNGAQTINMPYSGHFLTATTSRSDPHYNTGAAFTTATQITLQDRDAIAFTNT